MKQNSVIFLIPFSFFLINHTSLALPPPEDIPEEVLRTEIITEARSPIDGKPLTAAEYAELEEKLAQSAFEPELNPDVQQFIFLLRLRQMLLLLNPIPNLNP